MARPGQVGLDAHMATVDASAGIYRYYRGNFRSAGQNSYDSPPTQDQDAFMQLYNTLPITKGSLDRRWGIHSYSQLAARYKQLQEFDVMHGSKHVILAGAYGNKKSALVQEDLTTFDFDGDATPLFSFTTTDLPRILVSRDTAYATNGTDRLKHTGEHGGTQTNWGIAAADTSSNSTAATLPGTAAIFDNGFSPTWAGPNNIKADDGNDTATTILAPPPGGLAISKGLDCTNFSFSLPPGTTVLGIKVILGDAFFAGPGAIANISAQLLRAGSVAGSLRFSSTLTNDLAVYTLGGSSDLWGTTWLPSDTNVVNFGVRIIARNTGTAQAAIDLDYLKIVVYFSSPFTVGSPSSGNVTLLKGRTYAIAGKNSTTGHISDLSEFTATTGVLTNKQIPLTSLPVWTDSQVDQKVLLATADGNDTSTLYELTTIANATTSYTDNVKEEDLLLRNIYQEVDEQGNEHGVGGNTRPPQGSNITCVHRGRVYMLQEHFLYYSKNNDELLTSTGLITGRYEEAWPGDFQLDVSNTTETGSALFSDGVTLYIGTERHIRKLLGDGPDNFELPEIHFNELGVASQETLKVVYHAGQPAGVMWLTPDLRVMGSDFNTYTDVGHPIQDVLNSITRSVLDHSRATYFGTGVYSFYALAIPTSGSGTPDTICLYDLNGHKWHIWKLHAGVFIESLCFNIKADGTARLIAVLVNTTPSVTSWLVEFDQTYTQDVLDTSIGTFPITATAQTTWQYFLDPLSRKDFNELEVMTPDSSMLFSMSGATNSGEFTTPTSLVTSLTPATSLFGEKKFYLGAVPTRDRFYRMTFTSSANSRVILDAFSAEIIPEHKF